MNPNAREPEYRDRDRDLRLSRRLRAGVVSAGVVGSLGVAGVVGYAAVTAAQDPATATGTSGSSSGNTFSLPAGGDDGTQRQGGEHENEGFGDDGWGDDGQSGQLPGQSGQSGAQQSNPFANGQPPPQLQQGFGSPPQGSTSGS